MKRLVFAPTAREDLLLIGLYIAEDNPDRAETFVAEREAKAAEIFERRRQLSRERRHQPRPACSLHGRYLILFRDLEREVRIVPILHGARNLPQAFNT